MTDEQLAQMQNAMFQLMQKAHRVMNMITDEQLRRQTKNNADDEEKPNAK